jgi:hypothetical protein
MIKTRKARVHAATFCLLTAAAVAPPAKADMAATNSTAMATPSPAWKKPVWLTDLSGGVSESYDDNVLRVSGLGMPEQYSWVTSVSARAGVNFAPLLGAQSPFKFLTLVYAPDVNIYHNAPQETYSAQRVIDVIQAATGNFSFDLENTFLDNIGSRVAPTYALNQTSNTNDRYRNFYAYAAPRERRSQIQDRGAVSLQYDWQNFFIRPTASTIYYDLNTVFHNNTVAPYIGYQNFPDRYDANGGADTGYRLTPRLAMLLGYRYGYQYQEQFSETISPKDRHYSSNHYQRALIGLEGNLWSWLNVKALGGADFRNYNSMAAVSDPHPIYPYAEAVVTATLTTNQTLTFSTKEWQWLSSAGLVPYYDSSYALTYHWNADRQLGLDLGEKILNANFMDGDDTIGTEPSRRNDIEYSFVGGVTYAFTANFNANVSYNLNLGRNLLTGAIEAGYRNFDNNVVTVGIQYKF